MKTILLIIIGFNLLQADFIKIGDIVKDSFSKLEWQDDVTSSIMEWENAITYCEALNLGGYNDWRLPNINELKSIVDRSKIAPAIVDGFENICSIHDNVFYNSYWSSTTYEGYKGSAWAVDFGYGFVYHNGSKNSANYVRCVRAGQ